MNITQSGVKLQMLMLAIPLVLASMTSSAAGEDTQTKRQTLDNPSLSWLESLSVQERQELLYDMEPAPIPCPREVVVNVYRMDAELVASFIKRQGVPVEDQDIRKLLQQSDYLMSLDNQMYFILFE